MKHDNRKTAKPLPTMNREQEALYERWRPWTLKFANKFCARNGIAKHDCPSFNNAACVALWQTCIRFDPSKNTHFITPLMHRVHGELCDQIRGTATVNTKVGGYFSKNKDKVPVIISYDAPTANAQSDQELKRVLKITNPDPLDERIEAEFQVKCTETILRKLPKRYRIVMYKLYFENKTMKRVGAELGCSESLISQIHKEAIRMARTFGIKFND